MQIKKAIVTGGAGFIGSNLVDRLIDMGVEVHVIDNLSTGKAENVNPKAIFHKLDISTIEHPQWNWKDADVIFHLAAMARVQPSIDSPIPYHDSNVTGTLKMLQVAKALRISKFVFSSSSSVYGNASVPTSESHKLNPMSPYALHKLIGEQYCTLWSKLYGIDTVSLRYFNVYGNRMSLDGAYRLAIPIFASQIKEGIPCAINNDGNQRRDYTYVEDVINANILAATSSIIFNGEAYNVGNGNNVSINEVVDMMGGEKSYGNKVIEPFETLSSYAKIDLDLEWKPTGDLKKWINSYMTSIL